MGCLEERSLDTTSSRWSPPLYQGENPGQGLLSRCPAGLVFHQVGSVLTPGMFQAPLHRGVPALASRFPLQLLFGTMKSHLRVSLICDVGLSAFLPCWKLGPGIFSRGLRGPGFLGSQADLKGVLAPWQGFLPLLWSVQS